MKADVTSMGLKRRPTDKTFCLLINNKIEFDVEVKKWEMKHSHQKVVVEHAITSRVRKK
jgi:hypothetical protein